MPAVRRGLGTDPGHGHLQVGSAFNVWMKFYRLDACRVKKKADRHPRVSRSRQLRTRAGAIGRDGERRLGAERRQAA